MYCHVFGLKIDLFQMSANSPDMFDSMEIDNVSLDKVPMNELSCEQINCLDPFR